MENITRLYQAVAQELNAIGKLEQALAAKRQQTSSTVRQSQDVIRQQYATKRQQLQDQLRMAEGFLSNTIALVGGTRPQVPPQAPDFDRMQQLFVSIESPRDPAVEQLLRAAAGAVKYLENRLNQLGGEEAAALNSAAGVSGTTASRDDAIVAKKYDALLSGDLIRRLARAVQDQSSAYFIDKAAVYNLAIPTDTVEMLKFGVVQRPFAVPDRCEPALKNLFGVYYDSTTKTLRLPFGFRTDRAVKIMIRSPEVMKTRLQTALRGLVFNILRHYKPLPGRVLYIDPATYNSDHLGLMKHFVGPEQMIHFPTGDEAAYRALGQLTAGNSGEIRYLIVRGYPGNLSPKVRERIRNICNNTVPYGITVILTGPQENCGIVDAQDSSAMSDALSITADESHFHLAQGQESPIFAFFTEPRAMAPEMVKRFADAYMPKRLGSKYPDRVDLTTLPARVKGTRKFSVPYGVDEQDRLCNLDFSNTNFSMYLMGAAGSGKSTLLHTIITGLIRNYHPDDVELWLADFKMGEFSQYINPLPPHVKYILLDESPELVYDFVELLTQEMMRRKQYFSIHPDVKKLESLGGQVYMPTIFVIIDEFSLMSQAVYESEHHKTLLTNLLTEGRALGFKFIFSSQEYTKGIRGLSEGAKDQVQTRIAMKNSVDEIRQTLELPASAMTDQARRWIDSLPPHVALYKHYDSSRQENILSRAQVLYYPDGYGPQQRLIRGLNARLTAVPTERYDAKDLSSFVDKHPVIADGTSYTAFSAQRLQTAIAHFQNTHPEDCFPEDVFLSLGDPRRLIAGQLIQLTDESRENLLLMTGLETACATSIIHSAVQSFLLQQGRAEIWSYRRNRLFKLLSGSGTPCLTNPAQIGSAILELKHQIRANTPGRRLVVLLGLDRLLEELEQLETDDGTGGAADQLQQLGVSTLQEQEDYNRVKDIQKALNDELDRIEEEGEAAGKSEEEIEREIEAAIARYMGKQPAPTVPAPTPAPDPSRPTEKPNYLEDLRYILTRGSSLGYHFLLCAEDLPRLRNTKLKTELFRHRLSFCIGGEDASTLFGNRRAAKLPARICLYSSDTTQYTFRPYLHPNALWDGWTVNSQGNAQRGTI